jgi:hypothetical protein
MEQKGFDSEGDTMERFAYVNKQLYKRFNGNHTHDKELLKK